MRYALGDARRGNVPSVLREVNLSFYRKTFLYIKTGIDGCIEGSGIINQVDFMRSMCTVFGR